jgi:tetratricopeptide (TPR) repeat protein
VDRPQQGEERGKRRRSGREMPRLEQAGRGRSHGAHRGEEGTQKRRGGSRPQLRQVPDDLRGRRGDNPHPRVSPGRERRQVFRPTLPEERPRLAVGIYRELRATTRPNDLPDVARAVAAAGQALEAGDVDRATELLEWAKSVAARSAVIREALGIARYLAGDFGGAKRELLAYRRLSGRCDQNHLLADCARVTGRSEKVAEYVDEMVQAGAPADRVAEGLLVLAGERADRGDLRGSLCTLERADLDPCRIRPWHPRLWYFAGDLHERLGDRDCARDYFEAIVAVEDDFLDARDRLAALSIDGSRCQHPD